MPQQIEEPRAATQFHPVWGLAFRAGFLCAGLFAVAGMAHWLWWMYSPDTWDYRIYPSWWHGHEMIFGFAMPVVAGFLLSAVATWTGIAGTSGRALQLLFGLWLAARLVLWLFPAQATLAWLAEMGFIAVLTWELTRRVWAVRQWRNLLFPPVLLALALLSSLSYRSMDDLNLARQTHYGAIWMVTLLIVIIGGRVTPLFTGNRLGLKVSPLPLWFEGTVIALTAGIGLLAVLAPGSAVLPPLYFTASLLHGVRLARWHGWKTLRVPLLWSMHLSYLCIPLALLGLGLANGDPAAEKNVIHLLGVGAIGGMIIAMMARVSLGHTGRPLDVPGYLSAAFALVLLAALIRALVPLWDPALSMAAWRTSGLLWIGAFALWLLRYLPVLTRPRVDGKAG